MSAAVRERSEGTSFCSPLFLLEATGLRWRRASARLSCPEPTFRSGFSLSRNDRPFSSGHCGVTVPDLLLQCLARSFSGPFGPRLLATPVCARHRRSQHRVPVALISIPRSRFRLKSPLPFRDHSSLPDHSVRPDLFPGSSPSKAARSPVAPRPQYRRTDRNSGSAAASEANCSSNLLEPISFSPRPRRKSMSNSNPSNSEPCSKRPAL